MSFPQIKLDSLNIDFTDRVFTDITVDASPAAAAETIIATTAGLVSPRAECSVLVVAFAAFTVGGSGTAARLRIRRTDASGATKADTDAVTATAGNKMALTAVGVDALGAAGGQVYVATLTVTAAVAASTVSNVTLAAIVV